MFWAEHGPCYRCLYPEPPPPGMVPSCAEGGVLGVLCARIGSIQVNEAIKLIAGIGEPLVGRLMVYDALEMTYRPIKIRKDPECAVCGKNPTVTELIDYEAFCGTISQEAADAARDSTISVKDLKEMLDARDRGERDFLLVDVREPGEYEIVTIPGSVLVPKNDFLIGDALAALPQDKPVVLYCKTGQRSGRRSSPCSSPPACRTRCTSVAASSAWVNQIEPVQALDLTATSSAVRVRSRAGLAAALAALQPAERQPAGQHRQPEGGQAEHQGGRHRGHAIESGCRESGGERGLDGAQSARRGRGRPDGAAGEIDEAHRLPLQLARRRRARRRSGPRSRPTLSRTVPLTPTASLPGRWASANSRGSTC